MSGFAVLLDFDRPAVPERVSAIADQIARRGPHRRSRLVAGPCTMLHAALWSTPEAEWETQPQRHPDLDLWLSADARIDNRDELRRALDHSVRKPLQTDADFLLASYQRWGDDLVQHVIGDFALALWDGKCQEL